LRESVHIDSGALSAEIVTTGAAIRSIYLPGISHSLVLGVRDLGYYQAGNDEYFGATIGRFANRIGAGHLQIEGEAHRLACNDPPNHLHGGPTGFSVRSWAIEERRKDSVTLAYVSQDGEEGYPARVEARATFAVSNDAALTITYEAETDRTTVVNLTSHLYFNLDGDGGIRDHRLDVAADHYLPIDAGALPDGRILPVAGTLFDFRQAKPLRDAPDPLDHNFCLARGTTSEPRPVATLASARSGMRMRLATTEPGLQVYNGAKLDGTVLDLAGRPIGSRAAVALEPQGWPDSPNRPDFPPAVLRPGETYRHRSVYRFETA